MQLWPIQVLRDRLVMAYVPLPASTSLHNKLGVEFQDQPTLVFIKDRKASGSSGWP